MNLEFTLPEVVAVVVSVYILFQISGDGETNWIEGIQLLSALCDSRDSLFYLPEPQHGRALGFARFNLSARTCQVEL